MFLKNIRIFIQKFIYFDEKHRPRIVFSYLFLFQVTFTDTQLDIMRETNGVPLEEHQVPVLEHQVFFRVEFFYESFTPVTKVCNMANHTKLLHHS